MSLKLKLNPYISFLLLPYASARCRCPRPPSPFLLFCQPHTRAPPSHPIVTFLHNNTSPIPVHGRSLPSLPSPTAIPDPPPSAAAKHLLDLGSPVSPLRTRPVTTHTSSGSVGRHHPYSFPHLISHRPPSVTLPPPPPPPPPFFWFCRFLSSFSSSDHLWLDHYRMSKPSFYLLLQTLSPFLTSPSSSPLPPDHKLGATLFCLAHADPLAHVVRRFGFPSPALACQAFYESLKAVADCLPHLFKLSSDSNHVV